MRYMVTIPIPNVTVFIFVSPGGLLYLHCGARLLLDTLPRSSKAHLDFVPTSFSVTVNASLPYFSRKYIAAVTHRPPTDSPYGTQLAEHDLILKHHARNNCALEWIVIGEIFSGKMTHLFHLGISVT